MALDFKAVEHITGWMDEPECDFLYKYASLAPLPRVLEFGAYCGRSTAVVAQAMKERSGVVVTSDMFPKNSKFWGSSDIIIEDTYKEFKKNTAPWSDHIITMKGYHAEMMQRMDGLFGMCFVDGGHGSQELISTTFYAWEHLVDGGYLVWHDYGNSDWKSIKIFVDSFVASVGKEIIQNCGTLVAIQK